MGITIKQKRNIDVNTSKEDGWRQRKAVGPTRSTCFICMCRQRRGQPSRKMPDYCFDDSIELRNIIIIPNSNIKLLYPGIYWFYTVLKLYWLSFCFLLDRSCIASILNLFFIIIPRRLHRASGLKTNINE